MAGLGAAFLIRALVLLPGRSTGRSHPNRSAAQCGQSVVCDHQLLARQADQLAGGTAGDDCGRDPLAGWGRLTARM